MTPLRTLVLAENLPYPTYKGGDLRNWQNVNGLLEHGEVGVFGLCSNDRRPAVPPRAGITLWQSSTDPALAFPPPQDRVQQSRAWFLHPTAHPSDLYYSAAAAAHVEQILSAFRPHVVVIERLWLHRYIAHARPSGCRVVLDAHNIEVVLARQAAAAAPGDSVMHRVIRDRLPERTEAIERRAMQSVDQIWVCSESDARRVEALYHPPAGVHVVPNGVDVGAYRAGTAGPPADRHGEPATARSVVFPAMFTYGPNAGAARFLIEQVRPLLRRADPECQLVLVGSMPTPAMLDAARDDAGITVTGAVPDVRPFLHAASAMVVPVFEGSGTRFKILEAFAAGVPVITTAVGADGLCVEDGTHVLVAETAAEFTAAIMRLLADRRLADRLAAQARALVHDRYSWAVAARAITEAVAGLRHGSAGPAAAAGVPREEQPHPS